MEHDIIDTNNLIKLEDLAETVIQDILKILNLIWPFILITSILERVQDIINTNMLTNFEADCVRMLVVEWRQDLSRIWPSDLLLTQYYKGV